MKAFWERARVNLKRGHTLAKLTRKQFSLQAGFL